MNHSAPTPPMYPQAGEVIDGKYQIERLLGEGGMGAVARATHLLRRAPVALKFMSPHVMAVSGAVERFLNEGVAASQIDSENVVKVFDVGRLPNGAPYLVMECLDGQDLSELIHREGSPGIYDVPRCVHFVLQALRGLQVAHDAGIIHRDMKPSNCFVIQKDGEPDFVKLLDFGISKVQQPGGGHLTQTNSALGTPLYMSPEQAKSARNVDLRSDLYSCSVILYELLTGRTPFFSESGEFTEILFKIFTTEPPPIQSLRPDLPDGLAAVIMRGLAREAADRYVDAADMCEALIPWADERSRQVVTRIRHRAANQGRPTAAPLSELGSQANQSMAAAIGPRAVVTPYSGAAGGATGKLTPAEALASTRFSDVPGAPSPLAVSASGSSPNAGAEVRTAMSASSDARGDGRAGGGPKTPAFVFIVPAVMALALIGGVGAWKLRAPSAAAAGSITAPDDRMAAPVITTPAPPLNTVPSSVPTVVVNTPPPTVPTTTPATPAPSASATIAKTPTLPSHKATVANGATSPAAGTPSTPARKSLADIKPQE